MSTSSSNVSEPQPEQRLGDSIRNSLIGPGLLDLDF
jgi:hypothetical protein